MRKRRRPDPEPGFTRKEPTVRRQDIVEAAIRCIAKDGKAGCTVRAICSEAGVSRGLIGHYFPTMETLLIEVYRATLYDAVTDHIGDVFAESPENEALRAEWNLLRRVDAMFSPVAFSKDNIRVWLALWDEAATNPTVAIGQRRLYSDFYNSLADDIAAVAKERGKSLDALRLSRTLIGLLDGLWVSWCLDPETPSARSAQDAFREILELYLGPLHDPK